MDLLNLSKLKGNIIKKVIIKVDILKCFYCSYFTVSLNGIGSCPNDCPGRFEVISSIQWKGTESALGINKIQ